MASYERPSTFEQFEELSKRFLQHHYPDGEWHLYGRRGQTQHGIDVEDRSEAPMVRAGQAKKRLDVTWGMIEADLRKAKEKWENLAHFIFLTTSAPSAPVQDEVSTHNSQSGVLVTVHWWSDFEGWADEDVTGKALLATSTLFAINAASERALRLQTAAWLAGEVTRLRSMLESGRLGEAIALGSALEATRGFDAADAGIKSEMHRLLGNARYRMGSELAAASWRTALQLDPDGVRSRAAGALAELVWGDRATATEMAEAAVAADRDSEHGWIVRLLCCETESQRDGVLSRLPRRLSDHEGVRVAASNAIASDRHEILKQLRVRYPQNHVVACRLADHVRELVVHRSMARSPAGLRDDELDDLLALHEEAAELALATANPAAGAGTLIDIAELLVSVGDGVRATSFLSLALDVPADSSVLARAKFVRAYAQDAPAPAELLEESGSSRRASFLRARLLWLDPATRRDSCTLMLELLSVPTRRPGDCYFLISRLCAAGDPARAQSVVDASEPTFRAELQLHLALACTPEPAAELGELVRAVIDSGTVERIDTLVDGIVRLAATGKHAAAVSMLRDAAALGEIDIVYRTRLESRWLLELGLDFEALEACERGLELGEDVELSNRRLSLLYKYDEARALEAMRSAGDELQISDHGLVNYAILALRAGHGEEALRVLSRVTPPERIACDVGVRVPAVLHSLAPQRAAQFAYVLSRRFASSADVMSELFMCVFSPTPPGEEPPERIEVGHAVEVEKLGSGARWVFIERPLDGTPLLQDELSPDKGLGSALVGRSVGAEIEVDGPFGVREVYRVRALMPAPVRRAVGATDQAQMLEGEPRFASIPLLGTDGEYDFSRVAELVNRPQDEFQRLMSALRPQGAPLSSLAKLTHRPLFDLGVHCWTDAAISMPVTPGGPHEYAIARAVLNSTIDVVMDAVALSTVAALRAPILLARITKLVCPLAVEGQFRETAEKLSQPGEYLIVQEGQLLRVERDQAEADANGESLGQVSAALAAARVERSALAVAKLAPDTRARLSSLLDESTVVALAVAADVGGVLWTDDAALRLIAYRELAIASISSVGIVNVLIAEKEDLAADLHVALAAAGATVVPWSPHLIGHAIARSEGDPARLEYLVRAAAEPNIPLRARAETAAWVLFHWANTYGTQPPDELRQHLLAAVSRGSDDAPAVETLVDGLGRAIARSGAAGSDNSSAGDPD